MKIYTLKSTNGTEFYTIGVKFNTFLANMN